MKRRILSAVLSLIMVLTMVTGCAKEPATQTDSGKDKGEIKDVPESLTVALSAKYPSLDPNYYPTDISRLVMEELVAINYSTNEIEPMLAKSWEISPDGKVWKFQLRDDVVFHDGAKFTSKDVLYSADLAKEGPNAYAYTDVKFEAANDFEVTITFPEYNNLIKYDVSISVVNSEKHKELGNETYFEKLIGTGPYKLTSYDSATGIAVLDRNEEYWGEKGKQKDITFRVITSASTSLIALEKGEVDFAQIDSTIFDSVKKSEKLDVAFGTPCLAYFLVFNTEKYPTDDKRFRQAINHAIDRELVTTVSEVEGNYEINSAFYASTWGEKPEGIKEYDYNKEEAIKLLDDMGLKRPYDIGTVSVLPVHKNMIEAIQQNLSEIGITMKIELLDSVAHRDALQAGNFNIGITTGMDVNVAPSWSFYSFFNTNSTNYSRYKNETVDALSEKVYMSVDQNEVKASMDELMKIASEESLYGMLFLNGRVFAHKKGLVPDMSDNRNRHFENFYWAE